MCGDQSLVNVSISKFLQRELSIELGGVCKRSTDLVKLGKIRCDLVDVHHICAIDPTWLSKLPPWFGEHVHIITHHFADTRKQWEGVRMVQRVWDGDEEVV